MTKRQERKAVWALLKAECKNATSLEPDGWKWEKKVTYLDAKSSILERVWALLLIVTGIAIYVPLSPTMPRSGLDPSWMMAMNEAIAHKMAFGRDIVFTFGPYAPVYTKMFHPQTFGLACFGGFVVTFPWSVAMWVLFRHSKSWLRLLAIATAVGIIPGAGRLSSVDPHFFSYAMLAVFALFVLVKERARPLTLAFIVAILFVPFGLLPIIKGSMLIASAVVIFMSMSILAVGGYLRVSPIAGVVPAIAMPIFWKISGQSLSDLPAYLSSMLPIIEGYSSAMSLFGRPVVLALYLIAAIVMGAVLAFSQRGRPRLATLLVLTLVLLSFLVFKAGFVRHDGHAAIAGGFIAFIAVIIAANVRGKGGYAVLVAALISWGIINATTDHTTPIAMMKRMISVYRDTAVGLITSLTHPTTRIDSYNQQMALLRTDGQIGALNGTTDIYSYDQWKLIASGNTWAPRPILQSYSAYTPDLAYRNRDHLLGTDRPDNLIVAVQPIDGRLPALEDGASWPAMLTNYEPKAMLPAGLLLRHKGQASSPMAAIRKISQGRYPLDQDIPVPMTNETIFVEIDMVQTFAGKLENAVFKNGLVDIQAILVDGRKRKFRYIPEMGRSGFVLSPLIEDTSDFARLFGDHSFTEGRRVKSFTISPRTGSSAWNAQISVTFYELAIRPNLKGE